MILLSPHQLNRLTRPEQTIRHSAEDDLDAKMRAILDESDLNPHEKIKKYDALLQRYLNFLKQDRKEENNITVTLQTPPDDAAREGAGSSPVRVTEKGEDGVMTETLRSLSQRDRKNAEYMMKKISEHGDKWSPKGEFIHQGDSVKGSHMIDLMKHVMLRTRNAAPPTGWRKFLSTLAEFNIPASAIRNPQVREQYDRLKIGEREEEEEGEIQKGKKKKKNLKRKLILSPRWTTLQ